MNDALLGAFWGGLIGGLMGLGVCTWIIAGTWLFPGDTILFGIVLGGIGGWIGGEEFIDLLKWIVHWFWWW